MLDKRIPAEILKRWQAAHHHIARLFDAGRCRSVVPGKHPSGNRRSMMPSSVLDAIKQGIWDYEPQDQQPIEFRATGAMPGTDHKLTVLAERVRRGLPLWHPSDRRDYDQIHTDYDSN